MVKQEGEKLEKLCWCGQPAVHLSLGGGKNRCLQHRKMDGPLD